MTHSIPTKCTHDQSGLSRRYLCGPGKNLARPPSWVSLAELFRQRSSSVLISVTGGPGFRRERPATRRGIPKYPELAGSPKNLLACRISKRLAREARSYRRALRDHLRKETAQIRQLEIRSRGLRLYAAWASGGSNVIQTRPETTLADAAEVSIQEPLLLNGRSHGL
jgi:hypothetical protein